MSKKTAKKKSKKKAKRATKKKRSIYEICETSKIDITPAIIDRAKKIGLSNEQILTFPDAKSLKSYLDGISPQTNPDAKTKPGMPPKPVIHPDPMPTKFEFESKMENKFISQSRTQFDENALQAKLREINRKYGPGEPVKVVKTVFNKPTKGVLTTKFELFMRQGRIKHARTLDR